MSEKIKVKNFTGSSYGIFENGNFITSNDSFDKMIEQAIRISNEGEECRCTIATLTFHEGETPEIKEGIVIMAFAKIGDAVYVTNRLG